MNRNTAIVWTVLATLLCGSPGICLMSFGISSLMGAAQTPEDIMNMATSISVGFVLLAATIFVAFNSFKASRTSGITGLIWVTALSGLIQICLAIFFLIQANAATDTTGTGQSIGFFLVSGWFLLGISILIWFINARANPESQASITIFWFLESILFFGLPGLVGTFMAAMNLVLTLFAPGTYRYNVLQTLIELLLSLIGISIPVVLWSRRPHFTKPDEKADNEPL